jgi:hypothetical protein
MKPGDLVEWVGGTRTVGPHKEVAIKDGDRRRLVSIGNGRATLEGRDGRGLYGSVSVEDIRPAK